MAFAVLLLLLGMLGAELTLFGYDVAGFVAAGLWVGCAAVLVSRRELRPVSRGASPAAARPQRGGMPVAVRAR
jgi:hypothetical protein